MLVSHLANKHITSFGLPSYDSSGYYGLSDFLFLKESDDLNETISNITDKLSKIEMNNDNENDQHLQDSVNGLIENIKKLGIQNL